MTDPEEHIPRRLVAALMLTATLNPINSTMIAVALPAIAGAFGVSGGWVTTWLVSSYLIVNIALVSPAGKLGDLLGRRPALRLGQTALAAGAIVGGLSPVLWGVVAGRVLMAAGGAIVIPAALAALRGAVAPERRARMFASLGSLMGIAAAIGPLLGGLLITRVGWQAIFLVNAPLLLIAGLLARDMPTSAAEAAPTARRSGLRDLDVAGVGLLVVGLGAVAVALKTPVGRWALFPVGVLALVAFVLWEKRAPKPLIDLRLFRERHFVAGGLVIALQNLSLYALLFQLPFLFEGPMQLDAEQGGRFLMAMMAAMVVTAPIGGLLSERIGVRRTVLLGLAIGAGGLLLGLQAITDRALGLLLICLGSMGTGLGFVMGPNQAAALSAVSTGESGVASGVLSTMRYLGGLAGVSIISVLLNFDDSSGVADILAAHRLCVWIFLGAHGAALLVAALLPNKIDALRGSATEGSFAS